MRVSRLKSLQDSSVNFIIDRAGSITEARYVQRHRDQVICYLSIADGCAQACRFCHLTRTGQVSNRTTTPDELVQQALLVLKQYQRSSDPNHKALCLNYNFMARGEPLAQREFVENYKEYHDKLLAIGKLFGFKYIKFNISTIYPKVYEAMAKGYRNLYRFFPNDDTYLYYSLYSVNSSFREKWLPNAVNPNVAMDQLSERHWRTGTSIIIHHAMIAGENDSTEDAQNIAMYLRGYSQMVNFKFNLVRYNPFSEVYGKEADMDKITSAFTILNNVLSANDIQLVPRVGPDVFASCGMFISQDMHLQ
jgi:23S rRNA (adenine2503-C2)-methyltransferase